MQEKKRTFLDFVFRTDVLARRLSCDLDEVAGVIGISRSSLFAYRSGKSKITRKAWSKLDSAELEAGIGTAQLEQLMSKKRLTSRKPFGDSAAVGDVSEIDGKASPDSFLTKQQLNWFQLFSEFFLTQVSYLADVAAISSKHLANKEFAADLRHFSAEVKQHEAQFREWIELLVHQLTLQANTTDDLVSQVKNPNDSEVP